MAVRAAECAPSTGSGWPVPPDAADAAHARGGDREAGAAEDLPSWFARALAEERRAFGAAVEKIHREGQAALDEELGRRHRALTARLQDQSRLLHACGGPECLPSTPSQGGPDGWANRAAPRALPLPAQQSHSPEMAVLQEFSSRGTVSADDVQDVQSPKTAASSENVKKRVDTLIFEGFEGKEQESQWRLTKLVEDARFEMLMAVLIMLNGLQMAFEVQHSGLTRGYDLGYRDYAKNPDPWPGAKNIWNVLSIFFGVAFTCEVSLKIVALRTRFFKSCWNVFDLFVVFCFLVEMSAVVETSLKETTTLRLARLARLLRLARMVRKMESFGTLWLMATALHSSARILGWSCLLLIIIQAMVAFFINQLLDEFYFGGDHPQQEQEEVFEYFGSFSRALLSTFEMTLANWPPVCRLLMENVSEWFMVICLLHKLTIGFAAVAIINGVFIQETFRIASQDDFVMCYRKESAARIHRVKMERLFKAGDASGDGYLDKDEFLQLLQNEEVKMWLAAMGLDPSDGDALFDFMDANSDKNVSAAELIEGVEKLKGAARSLDVMIGLKRQEELHRALMDIHPEIEQRWKGRCCGSAVASEFRLPPPVGFEPPPPPQTTASVEIVTAVSAREDMCRMIT